MGTTTPQTRGPLLIVPVPVHRVTIKQFQLSATEVTRDQFEAFLRATGYQPSGFCEITDRANRYAGRRTANMWRDDSELPQGGAYPVVCVGWNDATAYAKWLSQKTGKPYRLPSEAEWEYSAKAGTTTERFWGANESAACKFSNTYDRTRAEVYGDHSMSPPCRDGYVFAAPVATFKPNAFGLFDMLGNVFEWVEDCYHENYAQAPVDGSAWLATQCEERIMRGGSYMGDVSSATRYVDSINNASNSKGFRVAKSE